MASQKLTLTRTSYTDPSQPANPTRQSGVQDAEALVDYTQHDKLLEQIHGSNLHGWGVASGLTVTATLGGPNLQVLPGVAVDSLGQHISLAFGGFAQSTASPDKVGDTTRLPVTNPTGVTIPTPAPGGSMYLTVQFLESFDLDSLIGHGVFQMYHSPWLQLVPTAGFVNDGTSLVLAQVMIDGAGHVASLTPGLRQGTSLPLQRLSFGNYALESGGGTSIGASVPEVGAMEPRAAGGLMISASAVGLRSPGGSERITLDGIAGKATMETANINHDLSVGGDLIVAGTISGQLAADLVGTDQLKDHSVTEAKLDASSRIPVGTIVGFAGATAPVGWLLCDGATHPRTAQFEALYQILQPIYGGDASHFRVPDFRSRIAIGAGQGQGLSGRSLGQSFGSEEQALSVAQLPPHSHQGTTGFGNPIFHRNVFQAGQNSAENHTPGWAGGAFADHTDVHYTMRNHTHDFATNVVGGGAAFGIMPPSLVISYIIKT